MSRRDDGPLVEILASFTQLPFWVSIAGALLAYAVFTWVVPRFMTGGLLGPALATDLPIFAPWISSFILAAGAIGVGRRWWRRYLLSRPSGIEAITTMTWQELELLVGQTYRQAGFAVIERGGRQPDGGVDLEASRNGERVLVQCKQWKQPVGVERVRELLGVVVGERATRGVIVAPGGFTGAARDFARGKTLELIDAKALATLKALLPAGPLVDPVAATLACPTCGKPMVQRITRKGPRAGSAFRGCSTYGQTDCRGTRAA